MKSLIIIFVFSMVSSLHADDMARDHNNTLLGDKAHSPALSSGPTTTHGYDRFCSNSENVQKRIKELNKVTSDELTKINAKAKEINSLEAKKKLLKDFFKLRDEFKTAFGILLNKTESSAKIEDDVQNMKSLLHTSIVLTLVNKMAKSKETDLKKICEEKENKDSNFCHLIDPVFTLFNHEVRTTKFSEEYVKSLQNVAKNFQADLSQVSNDKEQLKLIIQALYDQTKIEKNISPEKIFEDLTKFAPTITAELGKKNSAIENCLKNDKESCRSLLKDRGNQTHISNLITSELSSVQKEVFDTLLEKNQASYTANNENFTKEKRHLINESTKSFLKKYTALGDSANSVLSNDDLAELQTHCTAIRDDNIAPGACENISKKIMSNIETKANNFDNEKQKKEEELKALTSSASPLALNEQMKKYVLEKYARTCQNKDPAIQTNLTCKFFDALDGGISTLGSNVSSIVGLLQNQAATDKRGELGAFSKDELAVYSNVCQNTSVKSAYADLCDDIFKESNRIAHIKESKEWKEFHDKYWVEYNPRSSKGYDVYYKKSNWRILGEGLSQSVNSIYPIWFTNMQMSYQTDILLNQAMFQKQMMYMNSATSPWMNYPYFQGNFYPTNNTGFNFAN